MAHAARINDPDAGLLVGRNLLVLRVTKKGEGRTKQEARARAVEAALQHAVATA